MTIAERVSLLLNKVYDRMRHRAAFVVTEADAAEGDFEALRGEKYALLVTFRRNGEPVPSPVWFGLDDAGNAYVHTMDDVGKVKRLRNDNRALLVASNARGKPQGRPVRATARILPRDEWPHAESALQAAYGAGRRLYERLFDPEHVGTYIEITPTRPG